MNEAPRANPYAAPAATVADTGPPSRFLLTFAVVLHGFWCACTAVIVLGLLTFEPEVGRLLPFSLLAFTILYTFTITQLWRKRRWAWRACWAPVIAMLLFGLLGMVGSFLGDARNVPDKSAWLLMIGLLFGPAVALVPLQWLARREL